MTVTVNESCIGCTLCIQICPEVFTMREDKAFVYVHLVPIKYRESCVQAAEQCPVEAIEITR